MNTELKILPLSSITESKTNPRRHFDDAGLNELADSIKAKGIVNPILVRPVNSHYEIVAGARRYRASKMAQLAEMPAFIRPLSDEDALDIQIVENDQRENIHPLDRAIGYDQLKKKNHYTVETIAAKVSKSAAYVYQCLKLVDLIETAKKAFWEGKLTSTHATIIARLQPKDQERALTFALKMWPEYNGDHGHLNKLNPEPDEDSRIIEGIARTVCSVSDLTDFIQKRIHLDLRKAAFDKEDEQLVTKAGSCIKCPKRSGFNKELFSDITKSPDICTDPVCFALKQQVHVERLKAQFKKEKKKFIEVTADRTKPEGHAGAITERSFKKISGKPCKHARIGIYIDGANMGQIITLCKAKRECKQHWAEYQKQDTSRSSHSGQQATSYEERERQRTEKVAKATKRFAPIAQEIWSRIPKELPKKFDYVSLIAELLAHEVSYDFKQYKPKGLKLTPIQTVNLGLLCRKYDLDINYEGTIHPDLFKAAKSLGIKFEAILQKISDEEKAAKITKVTTKK